MHYTFEKNTSCFPSDYENLSWMKVELERKENEVETYKKLFHASTGETEMMQRRLDGM